MGQQPAIPEFREDVYLPEGVWRASETEAVFRFGASSRRRRRRVLRVRRWIELARDIGVRRFLLDGSFVTSKPEPGDVDAVVLLPLDFEQKIDEGNASALEVEAMLLTRHPQELFAAEDHTDWDAWVQFFGRTRAADGREKGLVEIDL